MSEWVCVHCTYMHRCNVTVFILNCASLVFESDGICLFLNCYANIVQYDLFSLLPQSLFRTKESQWNAIALHKLCKIERLYREVLFFLMQQTQWRVLQHLINYHIYWSISFCMLMKWVLMHKDLCQGWELESGDSSPSHKNTFLLTVLCTHQSNMSLTQTRNRDWALEMSLHVHRLVFFVLAFFFSSSHETLHRTIIQTLWAAGKF